MRAEHAGQRRIELDLDPPGVLFKLGERVVERLLQSRQLAVDFLGVDRARLAAIL